MPAGIDPKRFAMIVGVRPCETVTRTTFGRFRTANCYRVEGVRVMGRGRRAHASSNIPRATNPPATDTSTPEPTSPGGDNRMMSSKTTIQAATTAAGVRAIDIIRT